MFGVGLARLLRAAPRAREPAPHGGSASLACARRCGALACASAALAACAVAANGPPQRRAADAGYCFWAVAHGCALCGAAALADAATPSAPLPRLVAALSARHVMLASFLAANLLTGCVNLLLRDNGKGGTHGVPPHVAAPALFAYQLVVALVAWGLGGRGAVIEKMD